MFTIITIPEGFVSTTTAFVGSLWTDLTPVITLVIGLPLAFWVIRRIISLVRVG